MGRLHFVVVVVYVKINIENSYLCKTDMNVTFFKVCIVCVYVCGVFVCMDTLHHTLEVSAEARRGHQTPGVGVQMVRRASQQEQVLGTAEPPLQP